MSVLGLAAATAARPIPGFEHINRYFDAQRQRQAAKILPGEYYVTRSAELIVTVLGSCVSACVWDPIVNIGGMNHFMLPDSGEKIVVGNSISAATEAARYGSYAMEHLINTILKHGGKRERLLIKVVGGGRVLAGSTDVGAKNISFIREFIRNEGMNLMGEHVGGSWPRKVCFEPMTGKAQVKELITVTNATIAERERAYQKSLAKSAPAGDVELF